MDAGETPAHLQLGDARQRFRSECEQIRPDLHRFCSRMLGSVTEGEDAVQETLAIAFYKLPELEAWSALRAWMFRIAFRKCLDLQRARRRLGAPQEDDDVLKDETDVAAEHEAKQLASRVLRGIVVRLPVRERACVVLKDVLDHSLEEIAELTETSVGSVKAALHRGRLKLKDVVDAPPPPVAERDALVTAYLDRFNRRDWDGVRALLAADTRLEVVDRTDGVAGERYFGNYASLAWTWKLARARVDGREEIVHFRHRDGAWRPHAVVVLEIAEGRVRRIRDYVHVSYLLGDAQVEPIEPL